MPNIPTYRRKITPSPRTGAVPIPASVADRGAGAEAQGLAALGSGLSTLGKYLLRMKQDQIALNDSIAEIEAGKITDATNVEIATVRERLENKLDDKGNSTYESSADELYNTNFEQVAKLNVSDRKRELIIAKWEASKVAAVSRAKYASVLDTQTTGKASLELLIKEAILTEDLQTAIDANAKIIEIGHIIWGEGEDNERIRDAEIAGWKAEANKQKQATLARIKKEQKEALAEAQENTATDLFVGILNKKITDPQDVTDALGRRHITTADTKWLHAYMTSSKPAKLNLNVYTEVLAEFNDLKRDYTKENKAKFTSLVIKNISQIGETKAIGLIEDVAKLGDPSQPLNSNTADTYFGLLTKEWEDNEFSEDNQQNALIYNQKYERLKNFFQTTSNPTPKQAAEFYESLMKDVTTNWLDNWYWRYTWLGQANKAKQAVFGPKSSPYKEYPDAFRDGDNWFVIRDGVRKRIVD